jgi:predicted phosphodiesterase
MQESDSWSQDVVLGALLKNVSAQKTARRGYDFALLTGDLAYSGKASEYTLVAEFISELSAAAGLPMERIFCVPGNHDIDRNRQKLCFAGARATLKDQALVDEMLAGGEDLATLLLRQEAYRSFITTSFPHQHRKLTAESLAYVSEMRIDDIDIAIIGLDSSWMAYGGIDDHGRLLIGERQVIDAIEMALDSRPPPHLLIAIGHHPFHLLQEFDRLTTQLRIEQVCHFYHCGHLHEPEIRSIGGSEKSCLMIAAGATFETRKSQNAYSVISVDLANATRSVEICQYQPKLGQFVGLPAANYQLDLVPTRECNLKELADAIASVFPVCAFIKHYLAALILGVKADFPISRPNGIEFFSIDVVRAEPTSELNAATLQFFKFRNALGLFYGRADLSTVVSHYGVALKRFGELLSRLATVNALLKSRLSEYERGSAAIFPSSGRNEEDYTKELLLELAASEDWPLLREQASRHLNSVRHDTAILAKRLLALSLSRSTESDDRATAVALLQELWNSNNRSIQDAHILSSLLFNDERVNEAGAVMLAALKEFDSNAEALMELGQRIVAAGGDKDLRDALRSARSAGSS